MHVSCTCIIHLNTLTIHLKMQRLITNFCVFENVKHDRDLKHIYIFKVEHCFCKYSWDSWGYSFDIFTSSLPGPLPSYGKQLLNGHFCARCRSRTVLFALTVCFQFYRKIKNKKLTAIEFTSRTSCKAYCFARRAYVLKSKPLLKNNWHKHTSSVKRIIDYS